MFSMAGMCLDWEINNEEDQEAVDKIRKTLDAIWPSIETDEEDTGDEASIGVRMTPASYQDYIAYRDVIRRQLAGEMEREAVLKLVREEAGLDKGG
jgi:hypothetical protein